MRTKKSKLLLALATAALLASTSTATATEGWYGRADVGWSVDGGVEVEGVDLDFEDDWMASAGLGYAFQNGFRLEGELAHRQNDFEDFDGDARAWAAMANLYYDFNRGGDFQPYVGAGVGGAKVSAEGIVGPISFDDDDAVLAYQAMVGIAIAVSEQLDLDIGYRYFVAPDVSVSGEIDIETPEPFSIDGDYTHQAVMVGLRYQFAAPPPPAAPVQQQPAPQALPPPPPPVCPQSAFIVYFEWDRSNLNTAAIETIDAAAQRARECNIGSAVVIGHTDTSGPTQYNAALGGRRASVVQDALVQRGIPAGLMRTESRGETDLAQATRDGVREPLNRRTAVTITFQ